MNNDNNTILGFDVNLICDFFLNTERQGPGSPEVTLKALSFIDNYCCPVKLFQTKQIRADTSHEVSALLVIFVLRKNI